MSSAAYLPTPEEIAEHCAHFRRLRLDSMRQLDELETSAASSQSHTLSNTYGLSVDQVRSIEDRLMGGWRSYSEVAREFDLTNGLVTAIARRRHPHQREEREAMDAAAVADARRVEPLLRVLRESSGPGSTELRVFW